MHTIAQLLGKAAQSMSIDDACFLLEDACNVKRSFIQKNPDHVVPEKIATRFLGYVKKHKKGVPIPHIVGYAIFKQLVFAVDKQVLIPRSTTEMLVDAALETMFEHLGHRCEEHMIALDVGTGVGCIPITLLKALEESKTLPEHLYEEIPVIGIDIDKKALKLAKKNAIFHNVPLRLVHGSLLEPILNSHTLSKETCLIITAHLPYLEDEKVSNGQRIEPAHVLSGGIDGLELYRQFLEQLAAVRTFHTGHCHVFLECAPAQIKKIKTYIQTLFKKATIAVSKDFSGKNRMVFISL